MALFEEVVPEFSEIGQPVSTTFSIEVETIVATDEWIFTRVHWNHSRGGKRFDWALMRDTAAFDEFFAEGPRNGPRPVAYGGRRRPTGSPRRKLSGLRRKRSKS